MSIRMKIQKPGGGRSDKQTLDIYMNYSRSDGAALSSRAVAYELGYLPGYLGITLK